MVILEDITKVAKTMVKGLQLSAVCILFKRRACQFKLTSNEHLIISITSQSAVDLGVVLVRDHHLMVVRLHLYYAPTSTCRNGMLWLPTSTRAASLVRMNHSWPDDKYLQELVGAYLYHYLLCHLDCWLRHFTMLPNYITSSETPPLMDEMVKVPIFSVIIVTDLCGTR